MIRKIQRQALKKKTKGSSYKFHINWRWFQHKKYGDIYSVEHGGLKNYI